jgi:hypothetical protein
MNAFDSTFGSPQQFDPAPAEDPQHPAGANGQTTTEQLAAAIDPNDPRLISEALDEKLDGDAYALPPPAPDGKWKAKLKLAKIKGDDGQLHDHILTSRQGIDGGTPFYAVNIESSLIDFSGRYDGVKVTEYWVKSNVDARKGISQMTTIAQKAGATVAPRGTQKDRLDNLLKVLASEPEVIVETYWQASCQTCEAAAEKRGERKPNAFLRGEQRFPMKAGTAGHDPNVNCPVCKGGCRAQLKILQYFSIKETKPTRGLA